MRSIFYKILKILMLHQNKKRWMYLLLLGYKDGLGGSRGNAHLIPQDFRATARQPANRSVQRSHTK